MLNSKAWEALKFRRRCQADPVFFVRWVLGAKLWATQQAVLMDLVDSREVAVKSCHSAGKSFLAACAALWFLWSHPHSLVLTTAPTDRQVRTILWKEISTLHRKAMIRMGGTMLTKELHLDTDWFAMGFTAPEWNPDRFQGFHAEHLLFIVDEASGVAPKIYEAIDSIVTGKHSRLLMNGNPTDASGDFAKAFNPERIDVKKHTISVFDTPNFTEFGITLDDIRNKTWQQKVGKNEYPFPTLASPEWAAKMHVKAGEGTPLWQARVMGQFPDDNDNGLAPLSWVVAAQQRWYAREETDDWSDRSQLGVDVARMGNDSCAAPVFHQDQGIRQIHKRRKSLTHETVGWVNRILKDDETIWEVRVDADGLGAGTYDFLHEEHGARIIEIRGGRQANDPDHYFNSRSEMLWNVREGIDPNSEHPWALPPDEDLEAQITSVRWKVTPKGLIQVETKDDMKQRGMSSPDELDGVAYAAAEVSSHEPIRIDTSFGMIREE